MELRRMSMSRRFWLILFGLLTATGILTQICFTWLFFRFTDFSTQNNATSTVGASLAPGGGNAALGLIIIVVVLLGAIGIVWAISTVFFVVALTIERSPRINNAPVQYLGAMLAWLFVIFLPALLNVILVIYAAKHPPLLNLQ